MSAFRIRFCNDMVSSNGQPFHVCQREIEIAAAGDEAEAIAAAKREFESLEQVPNWELRARQVECEPLQEWD